jgi:hypothetical protein
MVVALLVWMLFFRFAYADRLSGDGKTRHLSLSGAVASLVRRR